MSSAGTRNLSGTSGEVKASAGKTPQEPQIQRVDTGLFRSIYRHRFFYLFVSPFFIIYSIFGLYPLIFSAYLSFVSWDGLTPKTWVGLGNFAMLLEDEVFRAAIWNTLVIALLYVPTMLFLAFTFAVCLDQSWLPFRSFFRASFFLPCVTPMVVIAIVFNLLYSPEQGLINYSFGLINDLLSNVFPERISRYLQIPLIGWITDPQWSKLSVAILVCWRWTGYNMVLMLAGLQGISDDYYEAAKVDGASVLQRIWHITMPLMRPTFLFCGIMSLVGTVYMFEEVFVLTEGGPGTSSLNFGLFLFNTSFVDFRFGYGSAAAYTVAVAVVLMSAFVLRINRPKEN